MRWSNSIHEKRIYCSSHWRRRWEWALTYANPTEKWSYRAGTGVFYLQDTGNPRFDMARNLSGRRRDNPTPLFPDLTLQQPFRGGTGSANNVCGVAPPLVCLSDIYVLGNMPNRKTPYMIQYLFNVQRELDKSTALEIGYLGSRSKRLERMFVSPARPDDPERGRADATLSFAGASGSRRQFSRTAPAGAAAATRTR